MNRNTVVTTMIHYDLADAVIEGEPRLVVGGQTFMSVPIGPDVNVLIHSPEAAYHLAHQFNAAAQRLLEATNGDEPTPNRSTP